MTQTNHRLWHVYHSLWGKAHDAPFYRKDDWNALYREVTANQEVTTDSALRRRVLHLALAQGVSEEEVNRFR